tara:strand:+ start:37 stop:447 length:411 start_codon:yes stop_codon:yes gene_type:complete
MDPSNFLIGIIVIIFIFTNILLININEKIDKNILFFCTIVQFIGIISVIKKYNMIMIIISKIFTFILIIGVFLFKNTYTNLLATFIVIITLISRFVYDKCLWKINKKNYNKKDLSADLLYTIILGLYLYKIIMNDV